jgi:hypothetical protein
VLVRWHKGLIHLVGDFQGDQFLIVNSWAKSMVVQCQDILGRVTASLTRPRPSVRLVEQFEAAYHGLVQLEQPANDDARDCLPY